MPLTGISIGKDIIVNISDTNNGAVTINRVKSWTANQKTNKRESIAIDGVNRHGNFPIGWSGSFEMERISPSVDAYFANIESLYQNGGQIPEITMNETVTEPDGTVSQFQYTQVSFQFDSSGTWVGDDFITQKISWEASFRRQLA